MNGSMLSIHTCKVDDDFLIIERLPGQQHRQAAYFLECFVLILKPLAIKLLRQVSANQTQTRFKYGQEGKKGRPSVMKYKMASVVTSVVQIVFERSQKTFLPKKNMLTSNPTREDKTNSNMWQRARVNVEDGPTQAEATAAK